MVSRRHLLVICTVWPEPLSSAAGTRILQLIEFFIEKSYRVTIACDAHETEYSDQLASYDVAKLPIQLNDSSFDQQLAAMKPDLVLFDRFMTEEKYGWRVAEQCPQALRLLDTEDLHCLRKARQVALKNGKPYEEILIQSDIAKREIASIYRCDLSLMISPFEIELLQSLFKMPDSILHYLPLVTEINGLEARTMQPDYEDRKHFISIGNFLHAPNADAVLQLKSVIWPLIRKQLPQAELHVYGAYVSETARSLHDEKTGFLVKGRAENAATVFSQARVLLAPLRFGAGIKGKLLDAMLSGTPSVTSSIGAEGMHGAWPWNGAIADDPSEFAYQAVELYQSVATWKEAQRCGYTLIEKLYDKNVHFDAFWKKLSTVTHNLSAHRHSNFTGAMLLHHQAASTKYMSRWIELKNKYP